MKSPIIILVILIIILTSFSIYLMTQIFTINNEEKMESHAEKFYKGSPKKGIYIDYLKKIKIYCIKYLKKNKNVKNKAIVIDFDDTVVWTRPHNPFPIVFKNTSNFGKVFSFPDLEPMISVVKTAKKLGYYIFIITSRPPSSLLSTIHNCYKSNLPFDAIFTSSFLREHPIFKTSLRKLIEEHNPKELIGLTTFKLLSKTKSKNKTNTTNIVMSIGDNWYDIVNGNKCVGIKLPTLVDFNSYVYYKNSIIELI